MTERDLVVGSASPPTADVPTFADRRAAADPSVDHESHSMQWVGRCQECPDDGDGAAVLGIDQSTWPAHLRDDAPRQRCGRCQRYTYALSEFGAICSMTQPDGLPCGGRFGSVAT